jgi:hypothetical protein
MPMPQEAVFAAVAAAQMTFDPWHHAARGAYDLVVAQVALDRVGPQKEADRRRPGVVLRAVSCAVVIWLHCNVHE